MRTRVLWIYMICAVLAASVALADQQANIDNGAFGSVHKDILYSIDTVSGKATVLASIPSTIGGIQTNASSDGVNSLALNTSSGVMYFTSNTASNNNKAIFYYDMINDQFGVLASDVTNLGVSFSGRGLGSAGAAFYDGRLYFGVEADATTTCDTKIYSLAVTNDGKAPSGNATMEFKSNSDSYCLQWGDFALGNDGGSVQLYIGGAVYSGGWKNKWQVWNLGNLQSQGDETIAVNNDKQYGQIGFDLNDNYYFVFGNTNKYAPINLATGNTGTQKDITVDGNNSPSTGSYDAAGIIPYHAEVRGGVWEDYDGDGQWDGNEPGISNVTVAIYEDLNNNGEYDSGERLLATDTTDTNGNYRIYDLLPGNFVVKVTDDNGVLTGGSFTTSTYSGFYIRTNQQKEDVNFGYRHSRNVSGSIYEDVDGHAQSSDFVGRPNVTVHLYQDDGDGIPNGSDVLVASTTTDSNGNYSFTNVSAALHWIVVDSKTVSPSAGLNSGANQDDVWAEQTYGAGGSWGGVLCDGDANSSTDAIVRSSNGACFGGRRGAVSDDASVLSTAEHVAKVSVGTSDVTGVDFGFSFNVVTNTNDQDDDANNGRTAQGSLRQFTQNANAVQGANAMRFVPAVPTNASGNGGNWWHLDLALDADGDNVVDILPPISDDNTTVDGTAYSYTDGTTQRDTNPGSVYGDVDVGTGPDGVVGSGDEHHLAPFDRPELEIRGHDAGGGAKRASAVITAEGADSAHPVSGVEIANLAIYDQNSGTRGQMYNQAVYFLHTSGGSVRDMLLGVRADGSVPSDAEKINVGYVVEDATGASVSRLCIAHTETHGVAMGYHAGYRTSNINFSDLEIFDTGKYKSWSDGFELQGTNGSTLKWSYIHDNHNALAGAQYGGSNVELWYGTTNSRVEECTLDKADNHGIVVSSQTDLSYSPQSLDNVIFHNVIRGSGGPGVLVTLFTDKNDGDQSDEATRRIRISENSIYDNAGVGIDILPTTSTDNGDGVTPNDGQTSDELQNEGLDYPIFTSVLLSGSTLKVKGYLGSNSAGQWLSGQYIIEVYKADNAPANQDGEIEKDDNKSWPHGEGRTYLGSCGVNIGAGDDGRFSCVMNNVANLQIGDYITATATDNNPNTSSVNSTSEFGPNALVPVWIEGTVFEDISGDVLTDGDNNVSDSNGDQVARDGVKVYVFKDDGNGVPDANDTLAGSATTDSSGAYAIAVPPAADPNQPDTYWLSVDSKSLTPSAGFNSNQLQSSVWAEQTYGPEGALCANPDGLLGNGDPYERTSAGPCYGGRRGAVSDSLPANLSTGSSLPDGAEHLAKVVVTNADVTGLDFGFSFNVVTNTNDQDDDANNGRTAQGSLRQFIQNANAIQGANAMRFVPAVSVNVTGDASHEWWELDLALDADNDGQVDQLPEISDDYTTLDGKAYSYTDGATQRDTNPGSVYGDVDVGTGNDGVEGSGDEHHLAPFDRPELEIQGRGAGSGGSPGPVLFVYGDSNSDKVEGVYIKNLALFYGQPNDGGSNSGTNRSVIRFKHASNSGLAESLVGVHADGSQPQGNYESASVGVYVQESDHISMTHVYSGHAQQYGVYLYSSTASRTEYVTISDTEVDYCGYNFQHGSNIAAYGTNELAIEYTYSHDAQVDNASTSSGGAGVKVMYGSSNVTITDGLFTGNKYHGLLFSSGGYYGNNQDVIVEHNVIKDNHGPGISLISKDSQQITCTENSIYDNTGLSIDLWASAGVTPNDGDTDNDDANNGLDYPIFTKAELDNGQLTLEGYIGTQDDKLAPDSGKTWKVEVYKADNDPADQNGEVEENDNRSEPHGEGRTYLATLQLQAGDFTNGDFSKTVAVSGLSGGDYITAITIDDQGNTSEFSANYLVHGLSPHAGEIVINEVLYRQTGSGASGNDEFVELYNAGNAAVDLSGWRLADGDPFYGTQDGFNYTFPAGVQLAPGEYAVIWLGSTADTATGASFEDHYGRSPQLNNSGDDIQLYDASKRVVDYIAYGSGSAVDPPPISNIWDDSHQSDLGGAAKGLSISLTPNGVDGNTSACWEKTTSGDASGNCPDYLPTIDSDDVVVSGIPRVTSVGTSNNGVRVSGKVYEDAQPNAMRDPGEDWANGVTVYVKLVDSGGSVAATAQVDAGSGEYHFNAVTAGDYTLVLDDNNDATDTTATAPSGWLFISPSSGNRAITVSTSAVSDQDFGLFHGSLVTGTVFNDTGAGAAAANDAVQGASEPGVPDATVTVSDDNNHTRSVQTDAQGRYRVYVPFGWGNVTLSHSLRPASGYNTDSTTNTVHQATSYADAISSTSSAATITLGSAASLAGDTLENQNFGVVFTGAFRPDQQGTATTPGSVTYGHTYKPGTQGTVTFARSGGDYTYQLRFDANCDGDYQDAGEDWATISGTSTPSFAVDDSWPRNPDGSLASCSLEVRVLVPAGEPDGAVDIAQITASLAWDNNAGVTDARAITDTTTVRTIGSLRLEKLARLVSDPANDQTPAPFPGSYSNNVSGRPGDVLEYCIGYRNIGAENISNVVISDPVPFFADALADAYGSGKAIYWKDAQNAESYLSAAAGDDAGEIQGGILHLQAEASLAPAQGGLVCYRVRLR